MTEEDKWIRRLKRVINDMPDGYVLFVRHQCAELVTYADKDLAFARDGDFDNCPSEYFVSLDRVEPHSEGM